jgi:hypothetical protein
MRGYPAAIAHSRSSRSANKSVANGSKRTSRGHSLPLPGVTVAKRKTAISAFGRTIDPAALTYRDFMRTRPPAHRFDSLEAETRAIKALETGGRARVIAMKRLVN